MRVRERRIEGGRREEGIGERERRVCGRKSMSEGEREISMYLRNYR